MNAWTTTAKGQRIAAPRTDIWPAGTYFLVVDRYTSGDGERYARGDTITLSEAEATRLGHADAIAPLGGRGGGR